MPVSRVTGTSSTSALMALDMGTAMTGVTCAPPAFRKCTGSCGKQRGNQGWDLGAGREQAGERREKRTLWCADFHYMHVVKCWGPINFSFSLLNLLLTQCGQRICSDENCPEGCMPGFCSLQVWEVWARQVITILQKMAPGDALPLWPDCFSLPLNNLSEFVHNDFFNVFSLVHIKHRKRYPFSLTKVYTIPSGKL